MTIAVSLGLSISSLIVAAGALAFAVHAWFAADDAKRKTDRLDGYVADLTPSRRP